MSGDSDAAILRSYDIGGADTEGLGLSDFENTVWLLVYNQRDEYLADADIRRGLSFSIDSRIFGDYPSGALRAAVDLVPPFMPMGGGNYRELAGPVINPRVSLMGADEYFAAGLDSLGQARIPGMQLLVADEAGMPFLAGFIQQQWQRELGVNVSILPLSRADIERRAASGDFKIALMPLSPPSPLPRISSPVLRPHPPLTCRDLPTRNTIRS